jgi:hypothetical protein
VEAGQVERRFIAVPEGTTWAEATLRVGGFDTPRKFFINAAQVSYYTNLLKSLDLDIEGYTWFLPEMLLLRVITVLGKELAFMLLKIASVHIEISSPGERTKWCKHFQHIFFMFFCCV